jgi:hypothetical protein
MDRIKLKMKINMISQHYDRNRLFVMFLILISALTIDVSISEVAPAVTIWGIVGFTVIAVIFITGQFFVLNMIKAKNNETKHHIHQPNINDYLDKTVTITQYVLATIMVLVLFQMLTMSLYYTDLLTAAVAVSYGLAALLLGLLAYRLISWYRINKSVVILIYALAYCIVVINAIDSLVLFDTILLGKPNTTVSPRSEVSFHGFIPGSTMSILPIVQTQTLVSYFVLTWAATIILLIHNVKRLGKLKFWLLIAAPSGYFLSYYLSSSSTIITSIYSGVVTGALIAVSFWSISRNVSQESHVRDYMILTAYGFILFFTAGGATVLQAGYPPFGLANVSFVGLAAYLILTGLYQSTISIAQDVKLRRSIKSATLQESSKFLDTLGTAQMEKQIQDTVMKISKENASTLAEQSGVEPSMTDDEMKSYMDEVIAEVVRTKRRDQT